MSEPLRVLFLGHGNSCRSQIAEGLCRHDFGDRIEPASAGVESRGLDPQAVTVLREVGIEISGRRSKTVEELGEPSSFDVVITVCDASRESCPFVPGKEGTNILHRGFEDPPHLARDAKDEEEALEHYRRVRDEIRAFLRTLAAVLEGGLP